MHNSKTRPLPHLGAFESTKLPGPAIDILGTTGHIELWREDIDMLFDAGVRSLRYSAPWHRIEPTPDAFDFAWMDQPMRRFEQLGMRVILDPLHHISFPDWLHEGFANPSFPELYSKYLVQLARRYPWVDQYTLVNEPLLTTILCSYAGVWCPHHASDAKFASMALNVARAICV